MNHTTNPASAPGVIIVSVVLDEPIASAFDQACGEALSSRAGYVRRVLAESLRASGHLPTLSVQRRGTR